MSIRAGKVTIIIIIIIVIGHLTACVPKCIGVHMRSTFGSAANFCLTFAVAVAVAIANENRTIQLQRSLPDFDKKAAHQGHYHAPHQRRRLTP
ncbi:hypothetical protein M5D96_005686, partial [Drosophila gunungcola]